MADKKFVLDLAKLVIAAAWSDENLANEEINALKDLLFSLDEVTGRDWDRLEIYMGSPVSPEDTAKLKSEVLNQIKTEEQKAFVLQTLEKLAKADGTVTEKEKSLLDGIREQMERVDTGFFSRLSKMIGAAINKRRDNYSCGTQRESRIDDFVKNAIYYELQEEIESGRVDFDLPEDKLRKLCFASGLLARISAVDEQISDNEKKAISKILSEQWSLTRGQAEAVTRVSCKRAVRGLDNFRLSRGFFETTDITERRAFLAALFRIANACGKTSYDETEEIRKIANALKLSHQDFIAAKLTIPDEDREKL